MIQIRKAELKDAEAISALVLANAARTLRAHYTEEQWAVFTKYYSPEAVRFKIVTQEVYCGEIGGRLVGTVAMANGFVLGFYTDPELIGRGIGTQLMQYLEEEARKMGIRVLELAASPVGVAYYSRHGWEMVGEEEFVYEGVGFWEVRMKKRLEARG